MSPTTFLADESWLPCSQHAVALAFLCAEWGKVPMFGDRRIVDDPDLTDAVENNVRALLLWSIREPLLRLIPANTQWFEVKHLRECHFAQLRAINHPVWNSPAADAAGSGPTSSAGLKAMARAKGRDRVAVPKVQRAWRSKAYVGAGSS